MAFFFDICGMGARAMLEGFSAGKIQCKYRTILYMFPRRREVMFVFIYLVAFFAMMVCVLKTHLALFPVPFLVLFICYRVVNKYWLRKRINGLLTFDDKDLEIETDGVKARIPYEEIRWIKVRRKAAGRYAVYVYSLIIATQNGELELNVENKHWFTDEDKRQFHEPPPDLKFCLVILHLKLNIPLRTWRDGRLYYGDF